MNIYFYTGIPQNGASMRYPDFLPENGTIGFVAPSFGCASDPYLSTFNNARKNFANMGYKEDVGPNCYAEEGIGISNTPKACGLELTESYLSSKNDIIISCGGGEMMCETLNYTDYEAISKAKPKWYIGNSDNTNFTYLSATLCDTAAIYGPCVSAFGMEPWHTAVEDAFSLLRGTKLSFTGYDGWEIESLKTPESPLVPYNVTEKTIIKKYQAGSSQSSDSDITMHGRLLGGCIDCLVNLTGTKFDKTRDFIERYETDGILWFLEACELNPMAVRRAMWQMKNAGWFEHCSGFIIGRPYTYGDVLMGLDHYRAVVDIISDLNVPILMDADIGHHPPMLPIVTGAIATVSTSANSYTIEYDLSND